MTRIRCVVERFTYQNPENGYTILKCRVKDYTDLIPVIGSLLDVNVGTKFAKKIVNRYGSDTFTVIEDNVELLIEIDGIGKKRLRSGLMYTLSTLADAGHVFACRDQLTESAEKLLEAPVDSLTAVLDEEERKVPIYLPPFYYAETGAASKLKKLAASPAGDRLYADLLAARAKTGNPDLSVDVSRIEQKVHINHYVMLQRNLIYTGITRAKKLLVMIGSKKALSLAVRNVTVSRRNTMLRERLRP